MIFLAHFYQSHFTSYLGRFVDALSFSFHPSLSLSLSLRCGTPSRARVSQCCCVHESTLLEAEARRERSSGGGSPTTATEVRVYLVASEK